MHSEHSKVALMSLVNKLPAGVFSAWSSVSAFFAQNVMPATSWSGGVVSSIGGLFSNEGSKADTEADTEAQEKYGVDKETAKELEKLHFKYLIAESMKGGNDEALLCSKARGSVSWGACEDYMTFTKSLAEKEKERMRNDPTAKKMRVSLNFAEDDIMIGKGGAKYFEQCWKQEGMAEAIDVKSKEWPGSNHETVLVDSEKGAITSIFEDIKNTC